MRIPHLATLLLILVSGLLAVAATARIQHGPRQDIQPPALLRVREQEELTGATTTGDMLKPTTTTDSENMSTTTDTTDTTETTSMTSTTSTTSPTTTSPDTTSTSSSEYMYWVKSGKQTY